MLFYRFDLVLGPHFPLRKLQYLTRDRVEEYVVLGAAARLVVEELVVCRGGGYVEEDLVRFRLAGWMSLTSWMSLWVEWGGEDTEENAGENTEEKELFNK